MTTLVFFIVYCVNILVDAAELVYTVRLRKTEYEQLK
jgi:hypothetical protein